MRNDVHVSPHFTLEEFADHNNNGLVVLDSELPMHLELLRWTAQRLLNKRVLVRITSGTRSERSNNKLAKQLGWTDNGGLVSPNSRHLPRFGGIAADLQLSISLQNHLLPAHELLTLARPIFPYCKPIDDFSIHVDLEERS